MSRYDVDTVEWDDVPTENVGELQRKKAVGLTEPDEAIVILNLLPGMAKATWSYKVTNGSRVRRLSLFQHIYTAQVKAIEEIDELYLEDERDERRQEQNRIDIQRIMAKTDAQYNAELSKIITEPTKTPFGTVYPDGSYVSDIAKGLAVAPEPIEYHHTETSPDPRIEDAIEEQVAIEPAPEPAPIIVNNAAEEIGYSTDVSNELADNFPDSDEPTPAELALQRKQADAMKASRKSSVPKVTNKGKTQKPAARKTATKKKT